MKDGRGKHMLQFSGKDYGSIYLSILGLVVTTVTVPTCHDHDIPPQPSHTYSCLLAVQTPPEHSLTKPEPILGLPNLSTAFPKR